MAPSSPLLEAHKLTVGVAGKVFCRDLDFALAAGERLAILGRNGAGKSTLLSVLAGLRAPLSGEVRVSGTTYAELGTRKSALIRGWLPQARGDAFASTVLETVLVGRHPHLERWGWESAQDAQIVRRALVAVDLAGLEQRDVQTLSGGERQRVAIATLLAQAPQLYLLDEPIGGVDPATRDYILHTIISNYNPEAAVIISTHLIADVEPVLDDVIFLDHGHVALHESCEEIRETRGQSVDALFREVFKCWEN